MPAGPFPIAQQTVVPVHSFRSFQRIRQPEQIVLFRQLAGAGTPEVIQFTGQLRTDTQLAPLLQKLKMAIGDVNWLVYFWLFKMTA